MSNIPQYKQYMMNNAVRRSCNSIQEARDDCFLSFITYVQATHKFLGACDVSSLRFHFEDSGVREVYYNSTNKIKMS